MKLLIKEYEELSEPDAILFNAMAEQGNVGAYAESIAMGDVKGYQAKPQTFDGEIKYDGETYFCDVKAHRVEETDLVDPKIVVNRILGTNHPTVLEPDEWEGLPVDAKLNQGTKIQTIAHQGIEFFLIIYAYDLTTVTRMVLHLNPNGFKLSSDMYRYLGTATANNIHIAIDLLKAFDKYNSEGLLYCVPFNQYADQWLEQFLNNKARNKTELSAQKRLSKYQPNYEVFIGETFSTRLDAKTRTTLRIKDWQFPFYICGDNNLRFTYERVLKERAAEMISPKKRRTV